MTVAKRAVHLDVYTDVAKRLALKLINSHSKCKPDLILPTNKLTKNYYLANYITFIVLRLQWYTRYHNMHIYFTATNNFSFISMLTNMCNLSCYLIALNERL